MDKSSWCGEHWIVFLRSCSYNTAPPISLSPRSQWSGPSPWEGPSCPQPWKSLSSPTNSSSKSLSAKKGPNISYNLVSPYSEGDLSLVPLKNNEISLPSFKTRQPFIQKHLTRRRVVLSQYLKLSCRFSFFRLPRSFCSWARRDWKRSSLWAKFSDDFHLSFLIFCSPAIDLSSILQLYWLQRWFAPETNPYCIANCKSRWQKWSTFEDDIKSQQELLCVSFLLYH